MLPQSIVDLDGVQLAVNDALGRLVSADPSSLAGTPLRALCHSSADEAVVERLLQEAVGGDVGGVVTYDLRTSADQVVTVRVTWTLICGGVDQPSTIGLAFHEETAAQRAEQELRRAALHDTLTGLPNRTLLLDRLSQALVRDRGRTAVLLVDLDHFKLVNDSRGHEVGDELLVSVAERLSTSVRPQDTVARIGGEFVVLAENVEVPAAQDLVRNVVDGLTPLFALRGSDVHVGASVGVALSPPSCAADLLRFADTAMYAAKAGGRGRVRFFDPALAADVEHQYVLSCRLREALNEQVLTMAYQPIVDLGTGAVLGMEALARWDDSLFGQVCPERFVAIAELTGLAPTLDRWAVVRALSEARTFRRVGAIPLTAYVSVNLSANNLTDPGLEELIVSTTTSSGLAPSNVMLEITESAVMKEAAGSISVLRRLRARGFPVALDDFGTGQSSLAYLRDLPISVLKIDRSFVAGIGENTDALSIAASVVDLGRAMGMTVIAEGVEDQEQAGLLRALGCQAAQGWLWSPAVAPEAVLKSMTWSRGFDVDQSSSVGVARRRPPRAEVGKEHGLDRLVTMHARGASLSTIAAALNRDGYLTPKGLRWHQASVSQVVADRARPRLTTPPLG